MDSFEELMAAYADLIERYKQLLDDVHNAEKEREESK